jgi:hypothetical protein
MQKCTIPLCLDVYGHFRIVGEFNLSFCLCKNVLFAPGFFEIAKMSAASFWGLKSWAAVHPIQQSLQTKVARFFSTQYTKTRENIPNYHNITKWP